MFSLLLKLLSPNSIVLLELFQTSFLKQSLFSVSNMIFHNIRFSLPQDMELATVKEFFFPFSIIVET